MYRATGYYSRLLAALSAVHSSAELRAKQSSPEFSRSLFNDNRGFVSFELEALFRDLELLAPLAPQPLPSSVVAFAGHLGCVDLNSTIARRCYSRRLCGSMDDLLQALVAARLRPSTSVVAVPVAVIKKVRPHFVAPAASNASVAAETARDAVGSSSSAAAVAVIGPTRDGALSQGSSAATELKRRLRATFFRRHPALQRLADVVLDAVVKNCCALALRHCSELLRRQDGCDQRDLLRAQFKGASIAAMVTDQYAPVVAQHAMALLSPMSISPEVREVAIELVVAIALSVGKETVVETVTTFVAKKISEEARRRMTEEKEGEEKEEVAADSPVCEEQQDYVSLILGGRLNHRPPPGGREYIAWCVERITITAKDDSAKGNTTLLAQVLPKLPALWASLLRNEPKQNKSKVAFLLRKLFAKQVLLAVLSNLGDDGVDCFGKFALTLVEKQLVPAVYVECGVLGVLSTSSIDNRPWRLAVQLSQQGRFRQLATRISCIQLSL